MGHFNPEKAKGTFSLLKKVGGACPHCFPGSAAPDTPRPSSKYNAQESPRDLVRIYYKGYSEKSDEWRPLYGDEKAYFPFIRQEIIPVPFDESLNERVELFKNLLYRERKRKLFFWTRRPNCSN